MKAYGLPRVYSSDPSGFIDFAIFDSINHEIMKVDRLSFCIFESLNGFGNPFFHVGIGLGMTFVAINPFRSDSRPGFLSGKRDPFLRNGKWDAVRRKLSDFPDDDPLMGC